jgi:chromosome segregation ATPase
MEPKEINQRLEWLDSERRKDKSALSAAETRILALEGSLNTLTEQLRQLNSDVGRMNAMQARFDQMDSDMGQVRVDLGRAIENVEKSRLDRERDLDKARRSDQSAMNKKIAELKLGSESLNEVKASLQTRVDEELRLSRILEGLQEKLDGSLRLDEAFRRSQRAVEDSARQDSKHISDLQGEVNALRKRSDETRTRLDLAVESTRKMESKFSEFQAAESERRQSQTSFLEKQALQQVDRDRVWKEWTERFFQIEKDAKSFEENLQAVEASRLTLRRAQEAFDEVSQRFERRINELTEMQRLTEERFRTEWLTYKNDDQKRWSNFTLTQDEVQRDVSRIMDEIQNKLINLEDNTQEMDDLQTALQTDIRKRMQMLLDSLAGWMDEFDRYTVRSR